MDERGICQRFAGRIRAYGLRHLRDDQAASDLVQQVLLAVVEALREGRIENLERIDAFVLGTCRNVSWDMRRAVSRQRRIADAVSAVLPESWQPEWRMVDRARLEHCLGSLEPRDRAVVMMTFGEECTAEEIGKALDVAPGNVRVIRHRTIARLQACMEGS